jgi:Soluble lytic murein transglycosylase and related regulatory proteins (some contain LysM/invasin domains)
MRLIGIGILLGAMSAQAQVLKIDLNKEFQNSKAVNIYEPGFEKTYKKQTSLVQLKYFESRQMWTECSQLGEKVFNQNKDLQGWVAQTWLNCIEKDFAKNKKSAFVDKALATISKHEALLRGSSWSRDLAGMWVRLSIGKLDTAATKPKAAVTAEVEKLLTDSDLLSREQKAQAYTYLGDQSLAQVNYKEAKFFYEEAQFYRDSNYLKEKLEFLAKAQKNGTAAAAGIPGATTTTVAEAKAVAGFWDGEEQKIDERIKQSLKQNEIMAAFQDILTLLNNFPGSQATKRWKDKTIDLYSNASSANQEKILTEMQKADSARLLEWAHALHRKGDFQGSYTLSQAAYDKAPSSPQSTSALWVLSRSAHFTGKYEAALKYYNLLVTAHAGTDESAEALLRSALIYYRQENFSNASALLERLMTLDKDRYQLSAFYWLVRSQEKVNAERAKTLAQDLMERYPFSYYGLRLRAEANQNKLVWPAAKEKTPILESEIYLVGEQKNSWKRFKTLAKSGWFNEAQAELLDMPAITNATLKVKLAEKLVEQFQFPFAIRWVNEAMETDSNLRREDVIKIAYPQIFKAQFQAEGTRYGVDPVLFQSLTRQESAFNMRAVSSSNALGLMQMIPPTAQEVAKKLGLKIEIPTDMFRPDVNIPMGSYYLSSVMDQFKGQVPLALASYNAGPYRMKLWLDSRPETSALREKNSSAPLDEIWFDELPWNETSFYVKAILRNVMIYRLIDRGPYDLNPVLWQDLLNKKAK